MQIIPAQMLERDGSSKKVLMLVCACALACGGCVAKKRPAFRVNQLAMNRPIVPQPADVSLSDAPIIPYEAEPAPHLVPPRPAPPRPRGVVAPASPGHSATEKQPEPIIAPELSDEQLSEAKLDTQQSLIVAERNLGLVQGRALNATQQDLISKIRAFVDSSRDAMKENDWQRARSQAKKAEVLSREFAPNP